MWFLSLKNERATGTMEQAKEDKQQQK